MAIVIDGSSAAGTVNLGTNGTISNLAVGGLPNGIVDTDMLASNAVTSAKTTLTGANSSLSNTYTTGISGNTNYDITLPANCFRVDFVGKNVSMSGSGGPGFRCSQTADGFLDNGQYTYAGAKQGSSTGGSWASGSSNDRFVIYDWIDNSAAAQWMIRAQFTKCGSGNGRHWLFIAEVAEYGSSEYQKTHGIAHTDGSSQSENLDKIRFYPDGTSFDSGDITWITWSTV